MIERWGGKEGEREGGKRGKEGGREGGREGKKGGERGKEGGKKRVRGREGAMEGEREGEREGGREEGRKGEVKCIYIGRALVLTSDLTRLVVLLSFVGHTSECRHTCTYIYGVESKYETDQLPQSDFL